MKEYKYTIEELKLTFADHASEYDLQRIKAITNFMDERPDDNLPAYLENDFNISRALSTICEEIEKLKDDV